MPPKIQRSIWELILMHLPSTKMLAQYLVEVLSTALNSLVAGLTSLKIWSTKSAKKRHLCASISAHSLYYRNQFLVKNSHGSLLLFFYTFLIRGEEVTYDGFFSGISSLDGRK